VAYAGVLDDVRAAVAGRAPRRFPAFALSEELDVRAAGISYEEYSLDAGKIERALSAGIRAFDYDWAQVYIDDCLEFEPLGVETAGSGNVPQSVSRYLPATPAALQTLRIPDPERDGSLPVLLEALRRLRERWADTILVCGRAPAPFSCLSLACGMEASLLLLHDAPDLALQVIRHFVEQQIAIGKAQLRAGAHALWIGDCPASSRFISEGCYREFALGPARDLVTGLMADGGSTIYFGAENDLRRLDAMAEVGADVLGLDERVDIEQAHLRLKGRSCIMGNIDPFGLLCGGRPADVAVRVREIRERVSARGGHLFNTAEGIPRDAPMENVLAMIQAIHAREE